METFRKIVPIEKVTFKIKREEPVLLVGSCFSENIGQLFERYQFKAFINPHGVIFNPITILEVLKNALLNENQQNQLYFHNEIWHSWQHNGSFSNTSKEQLEQKIASIIQPIRNQKSAVSTVFVTLGSAWAYRLKSSGTIVANCHKVPADLFEKVLLSPQEIGDIFTSLINQLPSTLNWVFTISPVRHWKDGVRENNLSKGVLHQLVNQLLCLKNVTYFPAYEIMLDELRDYRFYEKDMLHPNDVAIAYIWKRFSETYFDVETQQINEKIEKTLQLLAHKPIHINTSAFKQFDLQLKEAIRALKADNDIELNS